MRRKETETISDACTLNNAQFLFNVVHFFKPMSSGERSNVIFNHFAVLGTRTGKLVMPYLAKEISMYTCDEEYNIYAPTYKAPIDYMVPISLPERES